MGVLPAPSPEGVYADDTHASTSCGWRAAQKDLPYNVLGRVREVHIRPPEGEEGVSAILAAYAIVPSQTPGL